MNDNVDYRKPITHKYEAAYKLSPGTYEFLHTVNERSKNFLFICRNLNLFALNLGIEDAYKKEYEVLLLKLKSENLSITVISPTSGLYIYNLVRKHKPSIFLETGVDTGFSSRIILEAMAKNDKGTLVSTEVSGDVGRLVTEHLKNRWKLVVDDEKVVLKEALGTIDKIDVFMHDGDHRYEVMKSEFETVKNRMQPDGIMLSDDVGGNLAFMELAAALGKKPTLIAGRIKCFGIINLK